MKKGSVVFNVFLLIGTYIEFLIVFEAPQITILTAVPHNPLYCLSSC